MEMLDAATLVQMTGSENTMTKAGFGFCLQRRVATPPELRRRYHQNGWWNDQTVGQLLTEGIRKSHGLEFRVHSNHRPYTGTIGEVEVIARRLAEGLRQRGVGPGDVVAFQLPNWMEAAAVFWASALIGAVVVPVVHFYGARELSYILTATRPAAFFTAEAFGRMTYQAHVSAAVPIVGVVGRNFDDLLAPVPMDAALPTEPDEPALIAFTSGTTRDPKGVVHSHRTLGCEARQLLGTFPGDEKGLLTALPVGHFIGMLGALLCPTLLPSAIHLCDEWDPGRALALMDSDGIGIGGGPTYFITSLLDHPEFRSDHLRFIGKIGLGGSAVPAAVTRRLSDLGITVTRSYGSTEHPSITGTTSSAPEPKRLFTDGSPRPGVEVRLGEDGEIYSRGPDLCVGYVDPQLTADAFDEEGWYRTGDIGLLDADGYLSITDRKADVIIRGGENVSALEVEDILLEMPQIVEAVVVAAPDARLGEQVAAIVRIGHGHEMPTLAAVRQHFDAVGVARQKWPEILREAVDFPRTPSGKVQKYLVRNEFRTNSD